jgi:hypothetical protein
MLSEPMRDLVAADAMPWLAERFPGVTERARLRDRIPPPRVAPDHPRRWGYC